MILNQIKTSEFNEDHFKLDPSMKLMSDNMAQVLIDGQTVRLPTIEQWREIARLPDFMNEPVLSFSGTGLASRLLTFVNDHQREFLLGLYKPGTMKSWMVLPLYRRDGTLQRVQIERVTCKICESELCLANPEEPSLYFGVSDKEKAITEAKALVKKACPRCGCKLDRPAIWVKLIGVETSI